MNIFIMQLIETEYFFLVKRFGNIKNTLVHFCHKRHVISNDFYPLQWRIRETKQNMLATHRTMKRIIVTTMTMIYGSTFFPPPGFGRETGTKQASTRLVAGGDGFMD